MKLVIQRVKDARVDVQKKTTGQISKGLLCYVGFTHEDTLDVVEKAVKKILKLRIFDDEEGKMNLNVTQIPASLLVISQFTLYGDTSSNRPSWKEAAKPQYAKPLYDALISSLSSHIHTESGQFGAHMNVHYNNDGPVTIILELKG